MPAWAQLVYQLSHHDKTGVLSLAPADVRLGLADGWIRSIEVAPALLGVTRVPPRGEDVLKSLLQHVQTERAVFAEGKALQTGSVTPFHPAATLRAHAPISRDSVWLRAKMVGRNLQLTVPPHASAIAIDERSLVAFLTRAPRTWGEVTAAELCPTARAMRLMLFLEAMAAFTWMDAQSAHQRLGLDEGASAEEIRRAYRRLARLIHPDHHADATSDERRELERRFAELNRAYRELTA